MEKVKININNTKVWIEDVLALRGGREFIPCHYDGHKVIDIESLPEDEKLPFNAIQITLNGRHNCSVGEYLHFRKKSGPSSMVVDNWGVYDEVEVQVLASVNENTVVVSVPNDNFHTYINSADVETQLVSISDRFLLLPEDFDELGYSNQSIFYLRLEDYNKNESDWTKVKFLRPVYRKGPDFGNSFNSNYDRERINSFDFGVTDINTLYELPILSHYTYILDETVVEGGTEVESVPEDAEITEDSPELIYIQDIVNDCGIVSEVFEEYYPRDPLKTDDAAPPCDAEGNPILDECEIYTGFSEQTRTYYRKIEQVVFDLNTLENIPVTVNMVYDGNDVFANNYFYQKNGVYRFYNSVDLVRKKNYYELGVPILENSDYNMLQQNTIDELFSSEIKANIIPETIDMEKVMFEPAFSKSADDMVREIQFNFHFRERELEYRKIVDNPSNEVYGYLKDKPTITSVPTNLSTDMFIEQKYIRVNNGGAVEYYELAYKDGWNAIEGKGWNGIPRSSVTTASKFWKSDLIGHLNFNDDDVHYQKMKLKKSFIRLSFYDSDNPLTQQLLYYSTIFLDSGELFGKFVRNRAKNKWFGVFNEGDGEDDRLGVTVSVKDKYNSDKSSEGFYLYLFNTEVTRENPYKNIYMKVEFNHAGYGRTLPFTKPNLNIDGDNMRITPISFEDYFKRVYIKLGVQYTPYGDHNFVYFVEDDNTNTFMTVDDENKKIIFNLFEVLIDG